MSWKWWNPKSIFCYFCRQLYSYVRSYAPFIHPASSAHDRLQVRIRSCPICAGIYITAHFFFCSHAGLRFLVKYENRRVTQVYTGCCRGNATRTIAILIRTLARNRARPNYIADQRERQSVAALKPAIRSASLGVAHTWLFVKYVNRGELPTPRPISNYKTRFGTETERNDWFPTPRAAVFQVSIFFFFKHTPTHEATHTQMRRFGTNTQAWFALGACLTTIHSRSPTQAR